MKELLSSVVGIEGALRSDYDPSNPYPKTAVDEVQKAARLVQYHADKVLQAVKDVNDSRRKDMAGANMEEGLQDVLYQISRGYEALSQMGRFAWPEGFKRVSEALWSIAQKTRSM